MKKSSSIFLCFFVLIITSSHVFAQSRAGADSLLNFIKKNPSRSSLFLAKNDTVIARLNEDKLMPLASTVNILVAIEFAKQASHNLINENERVPLREIAKYYIPNTDGNAHPSWVSYENKLGNIIHDSVKLINVARGMMMFSSNANTEYLMDRLGQDNINSNIRMLGLKKHTPAYYLVSSLFIYQNPRKLSEDKLLKEISKVSDEDYVKFTSVTHDGLKYDSNYKKRLQPPDLTMKVQKSWSDRLPSSTTKEYIQLCSILNDRKYFDQDTYRILSEELETLMENPANSSWLVHAGMKGGSTIFVLTNAFYATLKNGNKIAMAYFFNDLSLSENMRLQKWMNYFDLAVLTDDIFRKQIVF
jgi:D-alanyl-D-alanine carboxypeptidase